MSYKAEIQLNNSQRVYSDCAINIIIPDKISKEILIHEYWFSEDE
jgi:hypothetical protein